MKKTFILLFLAAITLTSCSSDGDQGPQGPQGPAGADGLIGSVIDIESDFTAGNNYELGINFNDYNLEVFETDAVLVYLKTGEDGVADGAPVEVWRQMPQTYFINGEALQYNFDYTYFNVLIYLEGTVDFATLDSSYTDNQVLRVVVVPAEFSKDTSVDLSNMSAVLNALNLDQSEIKTMSISH
ncbi:hypothetical protein [Gillisia sp. Hel_I_29]|uniref:hypothetical protein n=1 Tax=Gillisia sp. Hel_I_29 TaxID=1249975 RepID=UPI00055765D8|nr:hypothetical protein [Gillisia sp. Hel_I_29]